MALLVVDDEPLNCDLLSRILAKSYEVLTTESGEEALTVMEERGTDIQLILCDQLMPGMCGTELAAEVKKKWPGTLFFLLTGYDEAPEIDAAMAQGQVHSLVVKPWRSKKLKASIEEALAAKSS